MEYLVLAVILFCLLAYGLYNGFSLLRESSSEEAERRRATNRSESRAVVTSSKPVTAEDIVKRAEELRADGWSVDLADDHLTLMAHKPVRLI
ncbi:MAG: hypothetical protein RDU25_05900 [Patescibacteria group bacterium]|nr:hypothetical protein [Patescibacteria group bacterium]